MMKRTFALLAFIVGFSSSAIAQSSPGLIFGQVPTPGQWNSYFHAKQDVLGYTPLNIAGGTMQGPLFTTASTAAQAGLRVPPGIAPSSPVNGDFWSTSAGFFGQANGVTYGPFTEGTSGSFTGSSPIVVSFPGGGVVNYAFDFTVANTFLAQQIDQGATTTSPGWYAQLTGDTQARVRVGLNATDVPSIALGPGGSTPRDAFIERVGAGALRFGAPDAAAPVAQSLSVQNVVAGTSNTAGANVTINGSQGTGTGLGGSIIFQVAPAGSSGTAQNALAAALTIDSTKLATFAGGIVGGSPTGGNKGAGTANFTGLVYNNGNAFAASAASPIVLNATTGQITCPTCLTGTGGAITANLTTTSGFSAGQVLYSDGSKVQAASVTGTLGNVVLSVAPSVSNLTVTTAFTATGLVTNADLANSTISGIALGNNLDTLTFGTHLAAGGSSYNGSAGVTITSDATNANTASTIVARDSSGNFLAGTITASLKLTGSPAISDTWHWGGDVSALFNLTTSGGTTPGGVDAASNTVPEIVAQFGITSATGSANSSTAYKVGLASWAIGNSGSSSIYGFNAISTANSSFNKVQTTAEFDITQNSGTNHVFTNIGTSQSSYGLSIILGGTNNAAAAEWITSIGAGVFSSGIVITSALNSSDSSGGAFIATGGGTAFGRAAGAWNFGLNFFSATFSGGVGGALVCPNNSCLGASNAAGNTVIPVIYLNASDIVIVGDATHSTVIGDALSVTGMTNVATTSAVCFNTSTHLLSYDGTIGTCTTSDERLKNMGERIPNALDRLLQISGVYYTWKDPKYGTGRQIGLGAQTVEKVFPELVQIGSDGYKSLDYQRLTAPIIEALRELKGDNDNLREQIKRLARDDLHRH